MYPLAASERSPSLRASWFAKTSNRFDSPETCIIRTSFRSRGQKRAARSTEGTCCSTYLALEHVLNERTGFGYLVEMATPTVRHQTRWPCCQYDSGDLLARGHSAGP